MSDYPIHTVDSAPEAARPLLQALSQNLGMIPNLAAAMAESPALLKGFLTVRQLYREGTFTPAEVEVLSLTAAFENRCAWCMAFHSRMAEKEGVSPADLQALRAGRSPVEPRLAALSDLAREMVRGRGEVSAEARARFHGAGYTREQSLEVVLGMGFSVLANYAGQLTDPPLEAPFQPQAWEPPA